MYSYVCMYVCVMYTVYVHTYITQDSLAQLLSSKQLFNVKEILVEQKYV